MDRSLVLHLLIEKQGFAISLSGARTLWRWRCSCWLRALRARAAATLSALVSPGEPLPRLLPPGEARPFPDERALLSDLPPVEREARWAPSCSTS